MKNLEKKIVWSIVLGLIVFVGFATLGDLRAIKDQLSTFNWWLVIPVLLLSLINYGIRFVRWQFLIRAIKVSVPIKDSILIFLSGFVMSVTPGKFGEVFKSYLLKKRDGVEISKTMPVVISERVTDLFALLVIISFGLLKFDYGRIVIVCTWVFLAMLVFIITQETIIRKILTFLSKIKYMKRVVTFAEKTYGSMRILLHPKMLFNGILVAILAWAAEGLGLYILLVGMGANISITSALFIYSFSTLVGAIAMLPGGLGATEGSMAGLLVLLEGISKSTSVVSTLLIRLATLWFAVIIGLIALMLYTRETKIDVDEVR